MEDPVFRIGLKVVIIKQVIKAKVNSSAECSSEEKDISFLIIFE
jgi:hypothetical protein